MTSDTLVVGLFAAASDAQQAIAAVRGLGFDDQHFGMLAPGQHLNLSQRAPGQLSHMLARAASAPDVSGAHALENMLIDLGVPDGEARFYASEVHDGRTLVVVDADGRFDEVRRLVLEHGGYDVQWRGAELIRGDGGIPGGVGPRPIDVTANWPDFASRYEMLWEQHYGTTDATWEQMQPVYRYAWQLANSPEYRGRPWSEVASVVGRSWQTSELSQSFSWSSVAGPIRDVWEDVAEEAAMGAEGGADRRITRQGTDQSVAARELRAPRQGAA
jgi:hypothetical protein